MQIVSSGDNLHEMSKKKNIFKLLSAENFIQSLTRVLDKKKISQKKKKNSQKKKKKISPQKHVAGVHLNCLIKATPMSTHNIWICGKIRFFLSRQTSYLELWKIYALYL